MNQTPHYRYHDAGPTWANGYLWPILLNSAEVIRDSLALGGGSRVRAFDLGCGSGATAGMLARVGFDVTGVDTSQSGISLATSAYPTCHFEQANAYDDLAGCFGHFSLVVSLEVVEHLYDPRKFVQTVYNLLDPGGSAVISTPYHGYLKNLALAVTGKFDKHFTVLWDGGHIKFFSIATFRVLLIEAGFSDIRFFRAGRVPLLAKSMVAIARRPPL